MFGLAQYDITLIIKRKLKQQGLKIQHGTFELTSKVKLMTYILWRTEGDESQNPRTGGHSTKGRIIISINTCYFL